MTKKEIIQGLQFTVDMFLSDPLTGEPITKPRNDMDKTTIDACKGAIELLEQQPSCEDCISRADVEQTVEDNILCYTHSDRPIDQDPDTECHMAIRTALRMLRKDLRKLPPVTPQPKVGHWIPYEVRLPDRTILNYRCSVCGRKLIGYNTETLSEAPFCHCGARMIEPQESEEV